MMMKLGPKKRRYTDDGRTCSTAFSFNGKAYTDCTTDLSPDGNTGKEWCFVSTAAKGDKFWSWCKPTLDWDQIREKNQEAMNKVNIMGRMVRERIEKFIKPGLEILEQIKKVKNGQAEFDDKLNKLTNEVTGMDQTFNNMKELKNQWEQQEEKVITASDSIFVFKNNIKEEKANKIPQTVTISAEVIKYEKEFNGVTINIMTQIKVVVDTVDCTGLLNYMDEPLGDGLIANYYDNDNYQGRPTSQKEGPIQFNWNGVAPITGVSGSTFSIQFEGYLYVPVTSRYKFSIECHDSAKLKIGGKTMVKVGHYTDNETFQTVEKRLKARADTYTTTKASSKVTSEDSIYLIGGSKEKILLEYSQSSANDFEDEEKAFLNLYWESDHLEEKIISKRYLYSNNNPSPMKIGNIDKNMGIIRKLAENDMAFKDSDRYMLMDVPILYLGLQTLKLNTKYTEKNISFQITEPSIIYVAVIENFPNPLPKDWDDTGQYMTLMLIDPIASAKTPGKIYGESSTMLQIFRKKYIPGTVNIPLEIGGVNVKGISMIVFFGADDEEGMECGGEELWISEPNEHNGHFKGCSESSRWRDFWGCRQGLSGEFADKEGGMWASRNEGVNAWLNVEFQNLYRISSIEFQDRNNPNERNSKITAHFLGDLKFEMKMLNTNERIKFALEPAIDSRFVKFVINDVYGTINNGGSFKIYGQKCITKEEARKKNSGFIKSLFYFPDNTILPIACGETLINAWAKFASVKKTPGNFVILKCLENCAMTVGNVYGSEKYTMDSAICKAAYHSKKLGENGGLVQMNFEQPQSNYVDEYVRGIQSLRKKTSAYTISFDFAEDENAIKLQAGIKVDTKINNQWQKGIIIDVKESATGKLVTITIEETEGQKPIIFNHPSENLKLCGEMIKNRDCKGSRKNFTIQPIKIRFAPSTYTKPSTAEYDDGDVYGKCGKSYGWSTDMSKNMREKQGARQAELETYVEFNYNENSEKCSEASYEYSCENATWSAKVGYGRYTVKLYVGHPFVPSLVNFRMNEEPLAVNKNIEPGTLETLMTQVDSIDQKITIRGDCMVNCKDARTILNMVEIYPFVETPLNTEVGLATNASSCNNAIKGGQCITGGGNIVHCLYDSPQSPGANFCGGTNIFLKVPNGYKCTDQLGKYKCVKRTYESESECLKFCPQPCRNEKCFYA